MDSGTMSGETQPIAVFDSGLGGLTVVRSLAESMPGEDIVYLGDSARVPYGIKSLETIRRFALEDAAFLGRFAPKLLVVACNTASAAAIDALESACDCSVVDVIRPGSAAAVDATAEHPEGSSLRSIGVIATEATVRSGAYRSAIQRLAPDRAVRVASCPLLVPIVEEGRDEADPIVTHVLCDYLRDLQRDRPGALVLGCTHYPLLAGAIGKLMGPATKLISSAAAAGERARRQLDEAGLRNRRLSGGGLKCYTTDNPARFAELGERFGGRVLRDVQYVGTDELETLDPAGGA